MLNAYFADMHIHIGRDMYNKPVKITGAKSLTLTNILKEASRNKGIQMIGVIDSHAPAVQQEIKKLIEAGDAKELAEGGIRFEQVTLLLGSEIDRKSTRLNSSHVAISYAVFCLKKKKDSNHRPPCQPVRD